MKITLDIKYIGVDDHITDLFEGQYVIPNGMSYNSYIIEDNKIAIMDTVDARFTDIWLSNIKNELKDKSPDFLIVHHMEPDHSGSIFAFSNAYPNAKIVASEKAFSMMKNFFGTDFKDRQIIVTEGDCLPLGVHTLHFIAAPMVHWPEVIVSYDDADKVLFSADAFGKFGALDTDEDWACEARRYYIGIVGKFGAQVQTLLKKASALDIKTICPLHGPILFDNLEYYFNLYNTWSSYSTESEGVVICYTSVYGNTKKAVMLLKEELLKEGCPKVSLTDLAREDMAEAIEDAFRYGKIVFATTTYNGDIFPFMRTFLEELKERNFQNKTVALIENGSWAPVASKVMKKALENSKNIKYCETEVKIMSALNSDSILSIKALAKELCK